MLQEMTFPFGDGNRMHPVFASQFRIRMSVIQHVQDHLEHGSPLPERPVAITLDDGFADNYTDAFPVFQEHDIPSTIFLAKDTLGGDNGWMYTNGYPRRRRFNG